MWSTVFIKLIHIYIHILSSIITTNLWNVIIMYMYTPFEQYTINRTKVYIDFIWLFSLYIVDKTIDGYNIRK